RLSRKASNLFAIVDEWRREALLKEKFWIFRRDLPKTINIEQHGHRRWHDELHRDEFCPKTYFGAGPSKAWIVIKCFDKVTKACRIAAGVVIQKKKIVAPGKLKPNIVSLSETDIVLQLQNFYFRIVRLHKFDGRVR